MRSSNVTTVESKETMTSPACWSICNSAMTAPWRLLILRVQNSSSTMIAMIKTVRWAFEHLTPEIPGDTANTSISVPRFWEADLPRSFILCLEDRAQPRWLAEVTARRLGVEPLAIKASHSPFLSRPTELAQLLGRCHDDDSGGPTTAGGLSLITRRSEVQILSRHSNRCSSCRSLGP